MFWPFQGGVVSQVTFSSVGKSPFELRTVFAGFLTNLPLLFLSICSLCLTSCGGGLIRTSGVVTLDGDPIRNAAVMFVPVDGGRPSTGRTDAEGRFELSTIVPGDGTAPGEYTVTITACESLVPEDEAGPVTDEDYENEQIRWIVPQRYSRAETSGLTADVGRKNHEFPFELETAESQERRTRSPASDG
jgi:hypothetical protein